MMTTRMVYGVPVVWVVASVAFASVLAIVYTLSPLTVITAALVPVLLRAATAGLPRREVRWVSALLFAAIGVRAAVILAMFVVSEHDAQAAAILTGDEAYALSRTLRMRNILLGIPGLKYDYGIAFEEYGRTSYLSVLTALQVLFGPAPYGLRLVNTLIFLSGAVMLFRLARAAFGSVPALGALAAIAFLPTLFFWSISLLKESLYFALTAGVLTAVYGAFRGRTMARRIAAVAAAAFAIWALRDLRSGAVYLVGGGVFIGVLGFFATASRRRLAATLLAVAVALAALASQSSVRDRVRTSIDQAARIQLGHVFTVGHAYKTLDEPFYVKLKDDTTLTTDEAARYVIRSIVSFLLVPLPGHETTPSELAFLPEHTLWYVALLLLPLGVVAGLRRDRLATCLLLGVMIPTSIVVALTNGNVGTLIRFRGLVWPYVLVLVSLGACSLLNRLLLRAARSDAHRAGHGPAMEHA